MQEFCPRSRYSSHNDNPEPSERPVCPGAGHKGGYPLVSLRILIVEDETICARDIEVMLNRLNYEVSGVVSNGEEAVEKVKKTHPDLILIDIKLKGDMDGIETAEIIRGLIPIPIIFMSAFTDEISLNRAKKIKPFFFVPKPIDTCELKAAIEKICSTREMEIELSRQT